MSNSNHDNSTDQDVLGDYVDYLRSVLASVGPGRGYVSLKKTPGRRSSAIANLKKNDLKWDDAFGVKGAYQLLMDCIIAAHHIDPMALEITEALPNNFPSNQEMIYRSLLSVDLAKSRLHLPLPLPQKDWQGLYDRVRKLFVDMVVSRLALDQLDCFINSLMSDPKISWVLKRDTLDDVVRLYASRHPKYDGYYDLSDTDAIAHVIEKGTTSIDLLRADIKKAVRIAQENISSSAFPSRTVLLKRIKEMMSCSNMNNMLAKRWRTTDDLLARSGP